MPHRFIQFLHAKHIFGIAFLLLAIVVFASSIELRQFIDGAMASIKSLIEKQEALGIFAFFVISALSAMLSPFSIIPLIPLAVLTWGGFVTNALVLAGWVTGGILSFMLARLVGRLILRKFISFEHIDHYLEKLPRKLEFEILLLFRFAVPAEIPGYAVGLTKYPFFPYLLATLLSELPFSVISVYASEAFLKKHYLPVVMSIITAALVIGVALHLFRRALRKYKEKTLLHNNT